MSTVDSITEGVVGGLNVVEWKSMSNQGSQIHSTFGNPLHGQWERSFKIRMQAGGDREILPHGRSQHDSINLLRGNSKDQNLPKITRQRDGAVQRLSFMTDGFDHDLRQFAIQ